MSSFFPLLSLQTTAGIVTLVGFLVVAGVVLFIFATTHKSGDNSDAKDKVYKFRRTYFWSLFTLVVLVTVFTLRSLPYPSYYQSAPDETVTIIGYQWGWRMGNGPLEVNANDFEGPQVISVSVNNDVEFEVTATDVNHSFGIYNSKGELITQVQAMPGYVNKLRHTFTEAGDYTVICLEYCGMSHGFMIGTIHVN